MLEGRRGTTMNKDDVLDRPGRRHTDTGRSRRRSRSRSSLRSRSRTPPMKADLRTQSVMVHSRHWRSTLQQFLFTSRERHGAITLFNSSDEPQYVLTPRDPDGVEIQALTPAALRTLPILIETAERGASGIKRFSDIFAVIERTSKHDRKIGSNQDQTQPLRADLQEELDKSRIEINDLKQKLELADKREKALLESATNRDKQLSDARASLTKLEETNARLTRDNTKFREVVAGNQATIGKLQSELAQSRDLVANLAAPDVVTSQIKQEPTGPAPAAVDLAWNPPDHEIITKFQKRKETAEFCKVLTIDAMAHSTVAMGWKMSSYHLASTDTHATAEFFPQCKCGTLIETLSHHDSLEHYAWVVQQSKDPQWKRDVEALERSGFKPRLTRKESVRALYLLMWQIRSALIEPVRHSSTAVNEAIHYVDGLRLANCDALISELDSGRFLDKARAMRLPASKPDVASWKLTAAVSGLWTRLSRHFKILDLPKP